MDTLLAYITAKDKDEARRVGKYLVEKRLAACVNIYPIVESHYWWEGKVESSEESVLIAKTTTGKQEALERAVREKHSYSAPCVLFFKADSGSKPYLEWIKNTCEGGA